MIARAERSDNGIAKWIATFIPLHQTAEEVFSRQFHRATLAILSLLKLFYIINCCRLFTSLDHYRTRGKEFVRLYKVLFDLSCKLEDVTTFVSFGRTVAWIVSCLLVSSPRDDVSFAWLPLGRLERGDSGHTQKLQKMLEVSVINN